MVGQIPRPRCKRCGKLHGRKHGKGWLNLCVAHRVRTDPPVPCGNIPRLGSDVCRKHGGNSSHIRASGEKRATAIRAERAVRKISDMMAEAEVDKELHPLDGLLEVVRRSAMMMRLLGSMVGELDSGPTMANGELALWGFDHNDDQAVNVLVTLYGQWSDRYARACKLALDANIDERLVRDAEKTSLILFEAIGRAVTATGLTPAQTNALRANLARELRMLEGPLVLEGEVKR